MEVIHPRCAGIDVSKKDAKVCVRIVGRGRTQETVTTWGSMNRAKVAAFLQVVDDLLEVAHRPAQPVQLGHHQRVPGPQVGQRLVQRRAPRQRPGRMFGERLLASRGRQRVGLRLGVLVPSAHPRVPDHRHPPNVSRTCLGCRSSRTRVARQLLLLDDRVLASRLVVDSLLEPIGGSPGPLASSQSPERPASRGGVG